MSRRYSRTSIAVTMSAALSTALLLAGCGSDAAPTDDTRAAAAAAEGEPVLASADDPQVDPDLVALVDDLRGAADELTTTRFALAVRGDQRVDVTGRLDVSGEGPALTATVVRPALGLEEVRVVDGTAYGLVGFAGMPAGWIEVPLPDLGALGATTSEGIDPDSIAERVGEVVTDVEQSTSATGTTYTADLDSGAVADLLAVAAGSIEVPGMPDLGSMLGAVPDAVAVTVDLDGAGRLTRVAAQSDDGSLTLSLSEHGAPVRVTAPARSRDLESLGFGSTAPTG